jgi:DNA-binding transcriptional LysR family regulator
MLILSGGFLGYLPEHYAEAWVRQGRMRALAPSRFGYVAPFQLAFRQDRIAVPRIAALVEAIAVAHGSALPRATRSRPAAG